MEEATPSNSQRAALWAPAFSRRGAVSSTSAARCSMVCSAGPHSESSAFYDPWKSYPSLSMDHAPLSCSAAAVAGDVDMRRVTVDGRFEFEREIRVAPRSPPKGTPEGLTPPNGNNGFLVFTPLITRDGSRILVQRGWWPAGTDVTHSASSTGASVTGVIRLVGEQVRT